MQPQELLNTLVEDIQKLATTDTIIGEPMEVGKSTVVPVIRLNVGFGAGGGEGEGTDPKTSSKGGGTGGGAGGGIKIEPAAFIVANNGDIQIMAPPKPKGGFAELFEAMPNIIEKALEMRQANGKAKEPETPKA